MTHIQTAIVSHISSPFITILPKYIYFTTAQ